MLSEISHTEKTNSIRNHHIVESKTKTSKQTKPQTQRDQKTSYQHPSSGEDRGLLVKRYKPSVTILVSSGNLMYSTVTAVNKSLFST